MAKKKTARKPTVHVEERNSTEPVHTVLQGKRCDAEIPMEVLVAMLRRELGVPENAIVHDPSFDYGGPNEDEHVMRFQWFVPNKRQTKPSPKKSKAKK